MSEASQRSFLMDEGSKERKPMNRTNSGMTARDVFKANQVHKRLGQDAPTIPSLSPLGDWKDLEFPTNGQPVESPMSESQINPFATESGGGTPSGLSGLPSMVSSRNVSEPDLNLDGGRMFGSGVLGAGGIGGVGTGMGGGADIAPWLMNDNEPEQRQSRAPSPPPPSPTHVPPPATRKSTLASLHIGHSSRKQSSSQSPASTSPYGAGSSHFSNSNPGTSPSGTDMTPSALGPDPGYGFPPRPAGLGQYNSSEDLEGAQHQTDAGKSLNRYQRNRSRNPSDESLQTLGGRVVSEGRSSNASLMNLNTRGSRLGSGASGMGGAGGPMGPGAAASDRKRGLSALTGLLKRKPQGGRDQLAEHRTSHSSLASVREPSPDGRDFNPPEHRGSGGSSLGKAYRILDIPPAGPTKGSLPRTKGQDSSRHDVAIRQGMDMHPDHAFQLDTDLDHMEGIIDLSTGPRQMSGPGAFFDPSASISSSGSGSDRPSGNAHSSTATFSTSAGDTTDPKSDTSGAKRKVVQSADTSPHTFSHPDPFSEPTGIVSNGSALPPASPHTHRRPIDLSQPRRPSQLRNVNGPDLLFSGEDPIDPSDSISKTTAQHERDRTITGPSVFNTDPFGTLTANHPKISPGLQGGLPSNMLALPPTEGDPLLSPSTLEPVNSPFLQGQAAAFPPMDSQEVQAAWTAPESWGVEGDDIPAEDASSDEADHLDDEGSVEDAEPTGQAAMAQPSMVSLNDKKPPPFGHGSVSKGAGRPGSKITNKRPSTGANSQLRSIRPSTTGRPGTAGSHVSVMHHIRIYNPNGSYTAMTFPLTATVNDCLQALAGKHMGPRGAMRIYLRERGQDRQLLPSEKPAAIQFRRLKQAGYSEAHDKLEELGKQNLTMLCRFIYQPPVLPVIDAEEEAAYDSFELVDLMGKNLQAIPIFLYKQAHTIISLNLSRNPLTDVPLDFVQACTALRELRMTYMAMKRVPSSIRQSMALTRLDISCNRIVDLEHVGLHEITTLVSLKVQNNRLSSLPNTFARMKGLKYLNISNNSFVAFPDIVCKMPNLMDLDVSFNEISTLPSELCELLSLERLVAVGNYIATFPESFSRLASLRELDVRRNRLTDLTAVYALPQLAILQADSNHLTALDAQLGSKVREFAVPRNNLTRFTLAPLAAASSGYALTTLDLSFAKLSTLADDALGQLLNLETLTLDSNKFARLPETLINLTNLRSLSCTDNVLTSLPSGIGKLELLRVLNVHNNNLQELPPSIWQCRSLVTLNASSNLLSAFPEPPLGEAAPSRDVSSRKASMVSDLSTPGSSGPPLGASIRRLYLGDNQLTDDIFDAVALMTELRLLNVGYNDIFEVPLGTLSNNGLLEELYLSGNSLTSLPSEDLETLTNLRQLHVNSNKLQTLPAELGKIRNLSTLDVGCNVLKYNIANWPYDWNWNWNLELRYLNLSGNKRLEIKPTSQNDAHVANNFRKDLSDFSKLTQLKILGLMDVTLRIPFLPDESEDRRVRTSFSEVNNMAYGIADCLGRIDHPSMCDLVVPNFRGREDECLFGMFGRAFPNVNRGKVAKYIQETFAGTLSDQLDYLSPEETTTDALRRAFLSANKSCYEFMTGSDKVRKGSAVSGMSIDTSHPPSGSAGNPAYQIRSGASGGALYLVGKRVYIATAGHVMAVVCNKGEAELMSVDHSPMLPDETIRIRAAEAWVSPRGLVNDELDVSRSFGFFNHVPAVVALPDVHIRDLGEADEFIILANKSLWDNCSYQTAVDIARTKRDDPMAAAHKLRDFAMSYGSDGAAMIMVICVADLFRVRGNRNRNLASAAEQGPAVTDSDVHYAGGQKRAGRRRAEDGVGDRTLLRLQQEVEPPTGMVALVFTDIKNSTSLWETNPGMQTAMRMHNSLLRRQLRIIGGYEVKTEGDAFMVSFPTIMSAVLWCVTCQMQLLVEDWPTEILDCEDGREITDSKGLVIQRGLSVRMGLHWGAPVWEKDPITGRMDYFGPMVNKSSRVSASADGGQIMGSLDVIKGLRGVIENVEALGTAAFSAEDLLTQDGADASQLKRLGLGVTDMGERKLKGLEVPEKLFLIHPKSLAGRLEISNQLRENIEVTPLKSETERLIQMDEVKHLVDVVLRLEGLSSKISSSQIRSEGPVPNPSTSKGKQAEKLRHLHYLGPRIKEDMTDEDLVVILQSLATRLENACSSLLLHQVGDYHATLTALAALLSTGPASLLHALKSFQQVMGNL